MIEPEIWKFCNLFLFFNFPGLFILIDNLPEEAFLYYQSKLILTSNFI